MEHSAADIVWHPETITSETANTLHGLQERSLLGPAYLAGGTGLSLRLGHRLSVDLDFFLPHRFDEEQLLQQLQIMPGFSLVEREPHTVHAVIQGTKVSFLGYPYPLLFPTERFREVPVASPLDIACMKLTAIASRGTKRDFIDLYVASHSLGLESVFTLFEQKYATVGYNRMHILKSLTFFDDAEKDPMPHMLIPLRWSDVRRFFEWQALGLAA